MSITVKSYIGDGLYEENSFLITDDNTGKTAIVDPSFLNYKSFDYKGEIEYVLLTHCHLDHIQNAEDIKKEYSAKIIIGVHEKEGLMNADINLTSTIGEPLTIEPDILVEDGEVITLGDSKITVMHTPGHTKGGVCYIVDNYIFTGDTVMGGTIGRCDLPTSDYGVMKDTIQKIKEKKEDYILCCGHGTNTSLNAEKKYNPYFKDDEFLF